VSKSENIYETSVCFLENTLSNILTASFYGPVHIDALCARLINQLKIVVASTKVFFLFFSFLFLFTQKKKKINR